MGSLVSPIVASIHMEKVETKALISVSGTTPCHWFRYVDGTWVKTATKKVKIFTVPIKEVDHNIMISHEVVRDKVLAFLDC